MIDHLTARAAKFDFSVQLHDDATPAVIDNPTVAWDGPEQRIAVITIPPQTFDSPEQISFGETSPTRRGTLCRSTARSVKSTRSARQSTWRARACATTPHVARAEPTGNEH